MVIQITNENGGTVVALEGRLDTTTSPQLEAALLHTLDSATDLTFDFKELEYLSSAGLRVIMATEKVMSRQGTMKLIHVKEEIMEVFEMTGLSDILKIE